MHRREGPLSGKSVSRKEMLRIAGAGFALGAGGAALAAGGYTTVRGMEETPAADAARVPFHGLNQAGIATQQQEHLHFAALDLVTEDLDAVRDLLRAWSDAAARMCAGQPAGDENESPFLPPDDTGEAMGLSPARLTLTMGFGPTLFERDGEDRYGLASRRPAALSYIPQLPGDALEEGRSGGDLCVQACADDPQVAFHAVRNLVRIARGTAVVRWSQLGFGRAASTSRTQSTPRNLMGLKDGTNNIKAEDGDLMDRFVWVPYSDGLKWMGGGTYLVARRIRMLIEVWDRVSLDDQERTIGRHKYSGAPIGGADEFDPVDLEARAEDGELLIPENSHVRLARASDEEKILRRGYSFTDGTDGLGRLDAGLFFLAYQKDARAGFIPVQRSLARHDALNEYIQHVGSAHFAVPPGVRDKGDWWGRALFA